jgi:hypothetical protein
MGILCHGGDAVGADHCYQLLCTVTSHVARRNFLVNWESKGWWMTRWL